MNFNPCSTYTINLCKLISLYYSFHLQKIKSNNTAYFMGLLGELNHLTYIKHLESKVPWQFIKCSTNVSHYYYIKVPIITTENFFIKQTRESYTIEKTLSFSPLTLPQVQLTPCFVSLTCFLDVLLD